MQTGWFRYAILWLSKGIGFAVYWSRRGWMPLILLLLSTASGLWLAEFLVNRFHPFGFKAGMWLQWGNVLGLDTVLLLLWLIGQARKRVVVEEFVDYTIRKKHDSPDLHNNQTKSDNANQLQSVAKGLATLLVVRLTQLRELYQAVNEQRIISTDVGLEQSVEAAINVDDVRGFLKDAISAESKFSFGFFQIPIGTIMAIIGRIFQGPRIIGALHGDEDNFILTAQRVGGKQSYGWRVDKARAEGEDIPNLDEMITELTYRVFTDIELAGSVRWKALKTFSEGLRAYRECLSTPRDRMLNLRAAERKLLETVAEDETFTLAYYNLGVVYTELGQFDAAFRAAAEAAFLEAIARNANSWRAFYALMVMRYRQKQYRSVIQLCDCVNAFKPGIANKARAYHWKGLAQRLTSGQRPAKKLNSSIATRKKSIAHAWLAICIAELKGQGRGRTKSRNLSRIRELASVCLVDLAVAYNYQAQFYSRSLEVYARAKGLLLGHLSGNSFSRIHMLMVLRIKRFQRRCRCSKAFRSSRALFQQALSLSPFSAANHFEFGQMFQAWKKFGQAVHEFESATQLHPNKIKYWAYLASASASLNDKKGMYYASKQVLEAASSAIGKEEAETFEKVAEAYRSMEQDEQSRRILGMNNFLLNVEEDVKRGKAGILEDKLGYCTQEGQEWEYAQILHALGQVYLGLNEPEKAKDCFQEAIDKLEKDYRQEIKLLGLRAWLARALLELQEYDGALQQVELALKLDPLSPFVRDVLGEVYERLNEFDHAITAWQASLLRKPYDPVVNFNIGISCVRVGLHCRDQKERNEAFRQGIIYLRQALDLYKSDQQQEKGKTSYFLGYLHIEQCEYKEAISCLKIAHALNYSQLSSTFYLGLAYLKNKEYDEAIDTFRDLLEELGDVKSQFDSEELSHATLFALTNWGLSSALVERDGKYNLDEAKNYIEKVESYIDILQENETPLVYNRANYYDTKGWMYYKQGEVTEAITWLEHALTLSSAAETYLHLAIAYQHRLQEATDLTELNSLITRVRLHCQHVQELDVKKEFEQTMQDLLSSLKVYEQISKDLLQAKLSNIPSGKVVSVPEQNQQGSY